MSEFFEHPEQEKLTSLLRRLQPKPIQEGVERTFYEAGYAAACQQLGRVETTGMAREAGAESWPQRLRRRMGFWPGVLAGLAASMLLVAGWNHLSTEVLPRVADSGVTEETLPVMVGHGEIFAVPENTSMVASQGSVFRITDLFGGEERIWPRGRAAWKKSGQGATFEPTAVWSGETIDSLMESDSTLSRTWVRVDTQGTVLRVFQGGGGDRAELY